MWPKIIHKISKICISFLNEYNNISNNINNKISDELSR